MVLKGTDWEIEREMAEPYSSASDADSILSEREAEWRETRSGGSNERGAANIEEEDWRDTQWDENGEPIYERG